MYAYHNDCTPLLDLINYCVEADDCDADINEVVRRLERIVPFESAIIGFGEATECNVVPHKLYSWGCDAWLDDYQRHDLVKVDPIVARALRDRKPFRWASAFCTAATQDPTYLEIKRGIGVNDGIAFAYPARYGRPELTLISLAIPARDMEQRHFTTIEYLLPHVHALLFRGAASAKTAVEGATIHLTQREIEVLNWVKAGKGSWDIGMLLHVSERTVKFHLSNVFSKLQVSTRAHALARAMQLGLIKL